MALAEKRTKKVKSGVKSSNTKKKKMNRTAVREAITSGEVTLAVLGNQILQLERNIGKAVRSIEDLGRLISPSRYSDKEVLSQLKKAISAAGAESVEGRKIERLYLKDVDNMAHWSGGEKNEAYEYAGNVLRKLSAKAEVAAGIPYSKEDISAMSMAERSRLASLVGYRMTDSSNKGNDHLSEIYNAQKKYKAGSKVSKSEGEVVRKKKKKRPVQ